MEQEHATDTVYSWQQLQVFVCFFPFMKQARRKGNGLQEIASGVVDDHENWRKQLRVEGELLSLISLTRPTTTKSYFLLIALSFSFFDQM